MLDEITIIQRSLLSLIRTICVVNISIDTTANIANLQRTIIVLLQMKGNGTILHVHTLDCTIAVRIPLLCFGYRNLVEDELRSRDKLTGIDAVCLYIALLIYLSTMTVRTRVKIISEEFEQTQSTISRPCAVAIANIQSLQELLHLLPSNSSFRCVIELLRYKIITSVLSNDFS